MQRRLLEPAGETCAIGLDLGGTKIAAGLIDGRGRILEQRTIPTLPSRGGVAVLAEAVNLAQALARHAHLQGLAVAGLGVAICELVGPRGDILSGQTVDWRGLPVRTQFSAVAPTLIEADSRAAAYAEAWLGAGRPFRSFYYVTVGTGIGGSWVLDGVPFAGATGCAGTLASSPMRVLCPACGAVRGSVLEEVASGSALVARYHACNGILHRSAADIIAAAERGDPSAQSVVQTAVECLGATLGLMVNTLDPEALIIGGGLGSARGLYWQALVPAIRAHIWSDVHRNLPLFQASLGSEAGWVGGALLAFSNLVPVHSLPAPSKHIPSQMEDSGREG